MWGCYLFFGQDERGRGIKKRKKKDFSVCQLGEQNASKHETFSFYSLFKWVILYILKSDSRLGLKANFSSLLSNHWEGCLSVCMSACVCVWSVPVLSVSVFVCVNMSECLRSFLFKAYKLYVFVFFFVCVCKKGLIWTAIHDKCECMHLSRILKHLMPSL